MQRQQAQGVPTGRSLQAIKELPAPRSLYRPSLASGQNLRAAVLFARRQAVAVERRAAAVRDCGLEYDTAADAGGQRKIWVGQGQAHTERVARRIEHAVDHCDGCDMSASDRRLGPYLRTAADLDAVEQKLDANNADVVGGIDAGGGMAAPSGWLAVFLVMAVGGLCDPLTLWRSGRKPGVAR